MILPSNFIHFPGCKKSINLNTVASIEWGGKNRNHKIVMNFTISEKVYQISLSDPIDKEILESCFGLRMQQNKQQLAELIKHLETEFEMQTMSHPGVFGILDVPKKS